MLGDTEPSSTLPPCDQPPGPYPVLTAAGVVHQDGSNTRRHGRPASAPHLRPVGRRLQRQRKAGGPNLRSEAAVRLGLRQLAYDIKGLLAPGSAPLPGMI
jgi:hypothetical protein